ncbi:hypothetical protein, partial [Enterococcus sp. 12E11_DIV0728]|uniref:hypothetical protein n=2 Tax=Enterococcus TaxID=1350 RepID=UPI000B6FF918
DNSLFGVDVPKSSEKQGLVEKLAVALDDQAKKEESRKVSEVFHAAEVDKMPSSSDTNLIKDQIPDKGKDEGIIKEPDSNKDEKPVPDPSPNPIPDPVPIPTPDPDPNPGPNPTPTPDPDPTPTPTPDPSINELIAQSKEELRDAADKVEGVNKKLTEVKAELDNMQNVESNTQEQAIVAAEQWDKVQGLINEYNQLSDQLKQLIDEDGTVPDVNTVLYKETYEQLNQKVTEIKGVQDSANATTGDMNTTIQNAEETLNQIDQIKTDYQQTQGNVKEATEQVSTAISNANKNERVSSAVQSDIDQSAVASSEMNAKNTEVGNQLDQVNTEETQQAIDSASQTAQTVNDQATEQNEAVSNVVNDFNNLPKPKVESNSETSSNQDTPDTPETQQQAPTDQGVVQTSAASTDQRF